MNPHMLCFLKAIPSSTVDAEAFWLLLPALVVWFERRPIHEQARCSLRTQSSKSQTQAASSNKTENEDRAGVKGASEYKMRPNGQYISQGKHVAALRLLESARRGLSFADE